MHALLPASVAVYYDPTHGDTVETAAQLACSLRSHPAILMWLVMNEPNFYYGGGGDFVQDAQAVVTAIKAVDTSRPTAVCWGELPPTWVLESVPSADVWASNLYRGATFSGVRNTAPHAAPRAPPPARANLTARSTRSADTRDASGAAHRR